MRCNTGRITTLPDRGLAVVVQEQIAGQYSGVAFSRDPVARCGDAVLIEALPGGAIQVVSGQVTPEAVPGDGAARRCAPHRRKCRGRLAHSRSTDPEGRRARGTTPARILQQVAYLARHFRSALPRHSPGTLNGPTTVNSCGYCKAAPLPPCRPIWTRKIAAEVIPGVIRPLTLVD